MRRVPDRKVLRTCALLFAAALVVRLVATTVIDVSRPPLGDEADYLAYTGALEQGRDYSWDVGSGLQRVRAIIDGRAGAEDLCRLSLSSYRTPLLPIVLTPVAWLGGGLPAMRLVNAVLGSLCAPILYLALRRSPMARHALWPAAAFVVWPPAVFLSLQLLAEPLALILVLGAIAVRADAPERLLPERQSFFAGLLVGLAILARPASLATTAFLAAARGTRRRALWFAIGATLVVTPWIARNWALHGRPLLTTNTGMTLVGSNCTAALDQAWPGKWVDMATAYRDAADPPDFEPPEFGWSTLSEEASDRRFAADAWRWIRENPGDFARLCFWKIVRLFDPDQHSNKPDAGLKRLVGWATYAPVLLLALVGARFAWQDRRAWAPWWALIAGTLVTTVVFHGDVRMRFPMDPALLAFATLAVTRLLPASAAPPGGDGRT